MYTIYLFPKNKINTNHLQKNVNYEEQNKECNEQMKRFQCVKFIDNVCTDISATELYQEKKIIMIEVKKCQEESQYEISFLNR